MNLLSGANKPIVIKSSNSLQNNLEKLKELYNISAPHIKGDIEREMKLINYGIIGENQILYELLNSHIPMCIIHDLSLEHNGISAQIDFLVITDKCIFIIESKNLYGNIEVTNTGDFIRHYKVNNKTYHEGIYSPITQNQRHLNIIKQIKLDNKSNIFSKLAFKLAGSTFYKSIVVLSNPKTILNTKYAKKEIKNQIIRCDQLINYIETTNKLEDIMPSSAKTMRSMGEFFLSLHKETESNFTKKYESYIQETQKLDMETPRLTSNGELIKNLKEYRLMVSRQENIRPYIVFTDKTLQLLIDKKPKTIEELKTISGLGESRIYKYCEYIIYMINK
ncbi:MAG: NERD domain-containing protein [Clostridium sp.]